MPGRIFISYRRSDSSAWTRRLADSLADRFGNGAVALDVQDLESGEDHEESLRRALDGARAVLVVIGPHWADARSLAGRRLDDPDDFVRREVEASLASGLPVIPVLVGGAELPLVPRLPEALDGLLKRNAIVLRDADWRSDFARLAAWLDRFEPAPLDGLKRRPASGVGRAPAAAAASARPPSPHAQPPSESAVPAVAPVISARTPDVFVSHAFEDAAWAERAVAALEGAGYACWIAPRDIVPGSSSYAREITRAIKVSRLMLVIVSEAAGQSDDVLSEITLAKNNRVPRLPLRIDDAPLDEGLEYFFSQAQRIDAAHRDPPAALARLLAAIRQQIGAPRPG